MIIYLVLNIFSTLFGPTQVPISTHTRYALIVTSYILTTQWNYGIHGTQMKSCQKRTYPPLHVYKIHG